MTESWHADEHLPVIARFEVRHRSYLAPGGSINRQLPAFASDTSLLAQDTRQCRYSPRRSSTYRAMARLPCSGKTLHG